MPHFLHVFLLFPFAPCLRSCILFSPVFPPPVVSSETNGLPTLTDKKSVAFYLLFSQPVCYTAQNAAEPGLSADDITFGLDS